MARLAGGIVLILLGAVWALQGLDVSFVPQGGMTGEVIWVIIGGAVMLLGLWLILSARRKGGTSGPDDNAA
jgi:LPXTG-motif cell wall-anchored protein